MATFHTVAEVRKYIRTIVDEDIGSLRKLKSWKAWFKAENPSPSRVVDKVLAQWKKSKSAVDRFPDGTIAFKRMPLARSIHGAVKKAFLPRRVAWSRTHILFDKGEKWLRNSSVAKRAIAKQLAAHEGLLKGAGRTVNPTKLADALVARLRQTTKGGAASGKLNAAWVEKEAGKIITQQTTKSVTTEAAGRRAQREAISTATKKKGGILAQLKKRLRGKSKAAAASGGGKTVGEAVKSVKGFKLSGLDATIRKALWKHKGLTGLAALAYAIGEASKIAQASMQAGVAEPMAKAKVAMEPSAQVQLEQVLAQQAGAGTVQMHQQAIRSAAMTGVGPDELAQAMPMTGTGLIHHRIP